MGLFINVDKLNKLSVTNKKTNKEMFSFKIYKCIKRKNNLYLHCMEGHAKLTFKTEQDAIIAQKQIISNEEKD